MKASAFEAQPKAKPISGMPPTAPCSIAQVTARGQPSSSRIRGTIEQIPNPRLAVIPSCSSIAARRATIFSTPCSARLKLDHGRMISPEIAGS